MNLRKTFFILPNLFTLSSVFCGFFAITLCAEQPTIDGLYQAAVAICFAYLLRSRRRPRRAPDQDAVGSRPAARLARRRHQLRRRAGAAGLPLGSHPLRQVGHLHRLPLLRRRRAAPGALQRARHAARLGEAGQVHHRPAGAGGLGGAGVAGAAQPPARRLLRRRRPAGARHPGGHAVVPDGEPHPLPLVQGSAPLAAHHHRVSRHRCLHRRGAHRPHALGAHLRRR